MSKRERSISEITEMAKAGISIDGDEAITTITALSRMLIAYITNDTSMERKTKAIEDLNKTADEYLGESNPLKNPEIAKSALGFTRYCHRHDTQRCLPDGEPSNEDDLRKDLEMEREDARWRSLTWQEQMEETRQHNARIATETE